MTIECSQSVHSIDIRPVYYGVQMVICGGKSRFHSVSMIIPGISEPPVRTLRATIPENERHIFR